MYLVNFPICAFVGKEPLANLHLPSGVRCPRGSAQKPPQVWLVKNLRTGRAFAAKSLGGSRRRDQMVAVYTSYYPLVN